MSYGHISFLVKALYLVLIINFETVAIILGQIAYTIKCSCSASVQPPVSLTFIHGPLILRYISLIN